MFTFRKGEERGGKAKKQKGELTVNKRLKLQKEKGYGRAKKRRVPLGPLGSCSGKVDPKEDLRARLRRAE